MRSTLRTVIGNQRGIVLVIALMLMGLMGALAAVYSKMILADTMTTGGTARARQGFYAAEAGLNHAMNDVRGLFASFAPPAHYTNSLAVGSGAVQRVVNYVVQEVPGKNPGPTAIIPAGHQFAGMTSIPSEFTVTAKATNSAGDEEAKLGAEFTIHSVPVFQFLAYYANTLEMSPGPTMTVSGRIHTNGNLYINTNAGSLFSIGDRLVAPTNRFISVSASGNIFRGRLDSSSCTGDVAIDMLKDINQPAAAPLPASPLGDLDPKLLACVGSGTTQVPTATIAAYQGSLVDQMNPLEVPSVSTLERAGSEEVGAYWQEADLRIVLNISAGLQVIPWATVCSAGVNAPNGSGLAAPALFPIEVQTVAGGRDVVRTNALWRFMCDRRGAIFYNDIPTNLATAAIPTIAAPTFSVSSQWLTFALTEPSNPDNYTPAFGTGNRIRAPLGLIVDATGTEANAPNNSPIAPFNGSTTDPQTLRTMVQWERQQRVYRRAGEDTNGDGVVDINGSIGTAATNITNNDRNDDICPMPPFINGTVAGAKSEHTTWGHSHGQL